MEIERQFLVTDASMVPVGRSMAQYEISQGYLSFEPELRIRQMNDEYFFTFKSAGGLVRREEEFNITKEDFENLLPRVQGELLKKVRREILLPSGEMAILTSMAESLTAFVWRKWSSRASRMPRRSIRLRGLARKSRTMRGLRRRISCSMAGCGSRTSCVENKFDASKRR